MPDENIKQLKEDYLREYSELKSKLQYLSKTKSEEILNKIAEESRRVIIPEIKKVLPESYEVELKTIGVNCDHYPSIDINFGDIEISITRRGRKSNQIDYFIKPIREVTDKFEDIYGIKIGIRG